MPRRSDDEFGPRESEVAYNSNNTSIDKMEMEGRPGGAINNPISADGGFHGSAEGAGPRANDVAGV